MTAQPSPDLPDSLQRQRDDWRARCEQAWTQLDQAQADLAAMTARAHTAENRATIVDITQLSDPGTRTLCNTCGHVQFTPAAPETGLSATLPAYGVSNVDEAGSEGQRGSEGGSGGAA